MLIRFAQDDFIVVKEVAAIDQLNDPENYVMTGIETSHIRPNIFGNFYLQDSSVYRSFSELDLQHLISLKKLFIEEKRRLKMFDIKALFANIQGYSLFTVFIGEIKLAQAIHQAVENEGYED